MAKGDDSTTTTTSSELPEYIKPYVDRFLPRAETVSTMPYQQYGGQRLAQFAPDTQAAFQQIRDTAGQAPTGITNAMVKNAPSCEEATAKLCEFMGASPVVAHNAAFDKRFLHSECQRIAITPTAPFLCSMLLAKRIYPTASSYKLSALLEYAKVTGTGDFHRALYDSEMTAKLWLAMLAELNLCYGLTNLTVAQAAKLAKTAKTAVPALLKSWAA